MAITTKQINRLTDSLVAVDDIAWVSRHVLVETLVHTVSDSNFVGSSHECLGQCIVVEDLISIAASDFES